MEEKKKEKMTLRKFLISSIITLGYLWTTFMIGIFMIYIFNMIVPADLISGNDLLVAIIILSAYFILDVGFLLQNKITPALIAVVVVASPFIAVAKLFRETEIVEIDNRVSSRVSNHVFLKKVFNTC